MATETLSAKLAEREAEQVEKLVKAGHYLNVSDFVREAIREKLSKVRMLPVRETTVKAAKKEIVDYLRTVPDAYPSDIAAALGLDLELTFQAVRGLVQEGRVG